MNRNVLTAARELVKGAERDGQAGSLAAADDLDRLGRALGADLPDWYRDLLATVPLIGLELGVGAPQASEDDEISWLLWLGPDAISTESLELYPGSAVLRHGYLCVGGCAHGSGDQYFLRSGAGDDDPPLVQIYHDLGTEAERILADGVVEIAPTLSAFFAEARTRLS
jgi:hypothetical protein